MSGKGFGKVSEPNKQPMNYSVYICPPGKTHAESLLIPVLVRSHRELALVVGRMIAMNRRLLEPGTELAVMRNPWTLADTDDLPEQTAKLGKILEASIAHLPSVFRLEATGRVTALSPQESAEVFFNIVREG